MADRKEEFLKDLAAEIRRLGIVHSKIPGVIVNIESDDINDICGADYRYSLGEFRPIHDFTWPKEG